MKHITILPHYEVLFSNNKKNDKYFMTFTYVSVQVYGEVSSVY